MAGCCGTHLESQHLAETDSESEASLVFLAHSRTVRATEKEPVLFCSTFPASNSVPGIQWELNI